LRQSILKKAFAGRLVLQDPSDEPAETLLARLRAEANDANPSAKVRRKQFA
jgi:type I restriction enzyme S subunit